MLLCRRSDFAAVAQLLDFLVERHRAVVVGGDAFEHLDAVLERANLSLQRLGLGVVSGDIVIAVAVAPDAVLGADDAADRHDEDDADDHFKRAHGEVPFLSLFLIS